MLIIVINVLVMIDNSEITIKKTTTTTKSCSMPREFPNTQVANDSTPFHPAMNPCHPHTKTRPNPQSLFSHHSLSSFS